MTNEEIITLLGSLSTASRREVEDLIASLRARHAASPPAAEKFENEAFFGIWSDRSEMRDSTAWVRSVREKHWAN